MDLEARPAPLNVAAPPRNAFAPVSLPSRGDAESGCRPPASPPDRRRSTGFESGRQTTLPTRPSMRVAAIWPALAAGRIGDGLDELITYHDQETRSASALPLARQVPRSSRWIAKRDRLLHFFLRSAPVQIFGELQADYVLTACAPAIPNSPAPPHLESLRLESDQKRHGRRR